MIDSDEAELLDVLKNVTVSNTNSAFVGKPIPFTEQETSIANLFSRLNKLERRVDELEEKIK